MEIDFRTQSESIGKIATALVAFQGEIEGVRKTSENPYFKSKYAELSEVWDAIRVPLGKNGLAVVQTFLSDSLVTTMVHTSGEWFRGTLKLSPVKANDPQAVGSAITYARRYALQAITGIAPIDDDGNAASGREHGRDDHYTAPHRPSEAPKPAGHGEASSNLHTSRFELSEPIKSKKGTMYWKAMDSRQDKFFIWDEKVCAALQVANGAEQTVRVEEKNGFLTIIEAVGPIKSHEHDAQEPV